MAEEARETALHEKFARSARARMVIASEMRSSGMPGADSPMKVDPWTLIEIIKSAEAAGVAEGIRQAREAVAAEDLVDDTGDRIDAAYRAAISDATAAIDALETADG